MAKKDNRVNFVIEGELLEQAKAIAAIHGIGLSELICNLLRAHVKKNADLLKQYFKLQQKANTIDETTTE